MIEETIQQIEARLDAATNLPPETRAELSALVARLRAEAARIPGSAGEENTKPNTGAETGSMDDTVEQLRRSVEEFEGSHPNLVQVANHLANTLSGLGI
jgi:hypothetical protein